MPSIAQPGAAGSGLHKQVQYLSGRDNTRTATWGFCCTSGRKRSYCTTVQVPSCWERRGFGAYNYGRDYKTSGKIFRFADEQGKYKHLFSVSADWQATAVYMAFEGAMTAAEVHWHTPRSGGGFLWALVDEGIARTAQRGFIDSAPSSPSTSATTPRT